jgi:hypothetical protein
MKKVAIWAEDVPQKVLGKRQVAALKAQLGSSSDAFIQGANEALMTYSVMLHLNRTSLTASKLNEQLTAISRHADGLAEALDTLEPDLTDLLDVQRLRNIHWTPLPDTELLRELAVDAKACTMPVRRGARPNGALTVLTRDLAAIYTAATGNRPTNYEDGPFHRVLLIVFEAAAIRATDLAPLLKRAFPKK